MFKKFLSGALAASIIVSGAAYANTATADAAAKVPAAKYTFNMDGASKNVVAVARKGDTSNFTTGNTETGVLPTAKDAKGIKLKYTAGKHKKALYLDRSKSYGAELKGVKLGSSSWTVSFWVKPDSSISNYMSVFFTGSKIADPKNTKWVSITKADWLDGGHTPTIWSHSLTNGKNDQFPWYSYQNKDGEWVGAKNDSKAMALNKGQWTYVTLVVDTKDTCEYGAKGEDGYVKSYHSFVYVNGKLYGNGTVAKGTMSNSNKFFLGINAWDTPFKGYFDDVKLWNKALTAKQVSALYKSAK